MEESRQEQEQQRLSLELLPAELQLAILERLSSCEDLTSLTIASRSYHNQYIAYKKGVLSQVTQNILGDSFVDACMLHRWRRTLGTYHPSSTLDTGHGLSTDAVDAQQWPRGPYRHVQLKFLHDCDSYALLDAEKQVALMRGLLTLEDFSQVLWFQHQVVRPLSELYGKSFTVRRTVRTDWDHWDTVPDPHCTPATKMLRVTRALYRFQACCQLYGHKATPEENGIVDLGNSQCFAMARDFFGRFDAVEKEELYTVYSLAAFDAQRYFGILRYNHDWRAVLLQRRAQAGARRCIDYNMVTSEPVGFNGVTAGVISQGLELLSRAGPCESDEDELAAVLVASDPPQLDNFMWDALMLLRDKGEFTTQWPESWSEHLSFWM
ncbi:hypothetical protein N8I77_009836 [Diaporthe amygdali]|uniref:F-box domain-containing protein n=1 Tax=Phomopsis amygdali TaxID=1214568 RepID=A0AAD9SC07_PHOAM|nr:hypothetical protein N8I77_009836 [Diaporthe amygdali]